MQFLIIHGSFGYPEENWFPQLKKSLGSLGQIVIAPEFPTDNWDEVTQKGPSVPTQKQTLDNWLIKFTSVKKMLDPKDKLCIVAHSLGPVFTLHLVQTHQLSLDAAIFVCPFLEKLNADWQIDHANSTFYKTDFDYDTLRKLIPLSYVLYSDNDPYVNSTYSLDFANKLDSQKIIVTGGGHLSARFGYTKFPLILELCRTRIPPHL
jgi:hypothetical protein